MSVLDSLISMIVLIGGIVLLLALQLRTSLITTGMKMRRAIPAQWILADFLKLNPSRRKLNQYYLFAEEHVRSLGHKFVGQVDGAVLHWDNAPILDLIIEYKFPMKQLPKKVRKEDVFQAGLYGLALLESGASCYSTKLVNIYCLQDKAKKCFQRKSFKNC